MQRFFLLLLIAIAGVGLWLGFNRGTFLTLLDRERPTIELEDEGRLYLGAKPGPINFVLVDNGAGLKTYELRLWQNDKLLLSDSKVVPAVQRNSKLMVAWELLPVHGRLQTGTVKFEIVVSDSSVWSNSESRAFEIPVDLRVPKVAINSLQHVAKQGGAQLVVFEASDDNLAEAGVRVRNRFFPALRVDGIVPGAETNDTVFAALFAIPLGFDSLKDRIEILARDLAGNQTKVPLRFRIDNYKQVLARPKLDLTFMQRKIPDLLESYYKLMPSASRLDLDKPGALKQGFKLINEDLRKLNDQKLQEVLSASGVSDRLWQDAFIRPLQAAVSSNFGELREYYFEGEEISKSVHLGFDLASVKNDSVLAANSGKVLFAEDLGIYGNTVIIDHGMGLSTLYAHLSSISVEVGQSLIKGQELGRSGETGLAGGDHLHFEFRLNGEPVTAIEWWDQKWINDQIFYKLPK